MASSSSSTAAVALVSIASSTASVAAAASPPASPDKRDAKTARQQDIRHSFLNAVNRINTTGTTRRKGSMFHGMTKDQAVEAAAFIAAHKEEKDYISQLNAYISKHFDIEVPKPRTYNTTRDLNRKKRKWNDVHSDQLVVSLLCADGHVRMHHVDGDTTLQQIVRIVTNETTIKPGELILRCQRTGEVLIDAKETPATLHSSELLRMVSVYATPQNAVRFFVGSRTPFESTVPAEVKGVRWVRMSHDSTIRPFAIHPQLVFHTFYDIAKAAFQLGKHTVITTADGSVIPCTGATMGAMDWIVSVSESALLTISTTASPSSATASSSSSSSAAAAAASAVV